MLGCTTDKPDFETVLEPSDADFDWSGLTGAFADADPDSEEELLGLLVQTPFLQVSLVHFPLVQEMEVEECDKWAIF
jgi:hypothetical protein